MERIVGLSWDTIQKLQQKDNSARKKVDTSRQGDHGADPVGDGTFRMVPSGDIVDFAERNRRLQK